MRREERAGGISERRREVKMSARFMVVRSFWAERRGARAEQAGAPRVLPLRRMCVWPEEFWSAVVFLWMSFSVSSFRPWSAREKVVDDMVEGMGGLQQGERFGRTGEELWEHNLMYEKLW